jgi:opacity protein-like surface antigen
MRGVMGVVGTIFVLLTLPGQAFAQLAGSAQRNSTKRVFIDVDFLVLGAPNETQHYSGTFTAFAGAPTTVTTASDYPSIGTAVGVQFRAGYLLWRNVGARVNFRSASAITQLELEATVPHPTLTVPAAIDETTADFKRRDTAVDISALFTLNITDRVRIDLFGGPTVFWIDQEMLDHISYVQTFDPAGPTNVVDLSEGAFTLERAENSVVGFNVGGGVSFFFHRHFGVGAEVTFSRGTMQLAEPLTGAEQRFKVGGFSFGTGIRLRF